MSLLYENTKDIPQMHVLLIGVAGYPYLNGGTNALQQAGDLSGLQQLSSPQFSIEALYNCLIELEKNSLLTTPIGSIEVLLSPNQKSKPAFEGNKPESATKKNISAAYYRWKKRCDTNPDNVALLYFCGHGLGDVEHFLLAEDFGENPDNPWDGAFAFDSTRLAFHSCLANTHIMLVDSCREVLSSNLRYDLTRIPGLEVPNKLKSNATRQLTMKAAAINEQAFGIPEKPSVFVTALINGLNGMASKNRSGKWTVSTGVLVSTIEDLIELVDKKKPPPQRCECQYLGDYAIVKRTDRPTVDMLIDCDPEAALGHAALAWHNIETNEKDAREPMPEPWNCVVKAGFYEIEATFPNNNYPRASDKTYVAPPKTITTINCV